MSWSNVEDPKCETVREARSPIETVIVPRTRDLGGFEVRRALPSAQRRMVGPFIFFDQMGPAEFLPGQGIDVRPHPHIGLATVTYLFDGEIMHRDSLGTVQPIRPGEVNWMTAGRGIVHSERTAAAPARGARPSCSASRPGSRCRSATRRRDPAFAHHGEAALPTIEGDGQGRPRSSPARPSAAASPVATFSEMFYADCALAPGAGAAARRRRTRSARPTWSAALSRSRGDRFEPGQLLVFRPRRPGHDPARLTPARFMLLGGEPMDGPRHIWWNFVSCARSGSSRPRPTGRPAASPRSRTTPSSSRCPRRKPPPPVPEGFRSAARRLELVGRRLIGRGLVGRRPVGDPVDQAGVVVRDQERAVRQLVEVDRAPATLPSAPSQPSMNTSWPVGWPSAEKCTRTTR